MKAVLFEQLYPVNNFFEKHGNYIDNKFFDLTKKSVNFNGKNLDGSSSIQQKNSRNFFKIEKICLEHKTFLFSFNICRIFIFSKHEKYTCVQDVIIISVFSSFVSTVCVCMYL